MPPLYLEFKDRRVDGLSTMALEAADDGVEHFLPDGHLLWVVVPGALWGATHTHTHKEDWSICDETPLMQISDVFMMTCCEEMVHLSNPKHSARLQAHLRGLENEHMLSLISNLRFQL